MADEEIVAKLREPPPQDAVTAANRLSELLERPLVHGAMIKYFKTAFPLVPLGLLMEATQWTRFGAADLTDEDFNELLAPWIGPVQTIDEKRIELARIRSEIDEDISRRFLREGPYRKKRDRRRLLLERQISEADGVPYAELVRTELGLEWYVVTDGSNVVLLSGDVGKSESWALQFEGVVESMYRTDDDDMKDSPLIGHGLGLHGLFRVHNSEWKREGHFHFIVCGKGGELSCLAQRYSSRTIAEPIESIRQRVLIIRTLK